MPTAIVRISTGEFVPGGGIPDGVVLKLVTVANNPNERTQKWSDALGVVEKTAQEIADYDAAQADESAALAFDPLRLQNAIVWAILDTYSAPATVTKFTAARTKILAAYKAKPWVP